MKNFAVTIEEDGGIAIPRIILDHLQLTDGDTVAIDEKDGRLFVRKMDDFAEKSPAS